MTNYRFEFDHVEKTIEVIEVVKTAFKGRNLTYIHSNSIAVYKYTAEEHHVGLETLSGYAPPEVYNMMAAAFYIWHDINRGFLWKSTFEQRLSE